MGADVYPLATDPDPELPLDVDRAAAAEVETWFMRVDEALRGFVTGRTPAPTVTLWPEHFDVATTVDEVNYGGSPGDDEHDTPYAYVGPWAPQDGVFWTEPFGASRLATDLPTAGAVLEFFREGEAHVAAPGKQPPP
jgi:hypothetical protein